MYKDKMKAIPKEGIIGVEALSTFFEYYQSLMDVYNFGKFNPRLHLNASESLEKRVNQRFIYNLFTKGDKEEFIKYVSEYYTDIRLELYENRVILRVTDKKTDSEGILYMTAIMKGVELNLSFMDTEETNLYNERGYIEVLVSTPKIMDAVKYPLILGNLLSLRMTTLREEQKNTTRSHPFLLELTNLKDGTKEYQYYLNTKDFTMAIEKEKMQLSLLVDEAKTFIIRTKEAIGKVTKILDMDEYLEGRAELLKQLELQKQSQESTKTNVDNILAENNK